MALNRQTKDKWKAQKRQDRIDAAKVFAEIDRRSLLNQKRYTVLQQGRVLSQGLPMKEVINKFGGNLKNLTLLPE